MAVSTTTNRITYTGNGATTAFSVPYAYYNQTHLQVYLDGVLKTLTTHYTVSPTTNTPNGVIGGTVTFITAPGSAVTVLIVRVVPFTQDTDLVDLSKFPADTVEQGFDLNVMKEQQLKEVDDRTLQWPITVTTGPSNQLPDPSVAVNQGKILRVKTDGTGIDLITPASADPVTVLTTKGDIAVRSATVIQRLPVGSDGKILKTDSTALLGVSWTDLLYVAGLGPHAIGGVTSAGVSLVLPGGLDATGQATGATLKLSAPSLNATTNYTFWSATGNVFIQPSALASSQDGSLVMGKVGVIGSGVKFPAEIRWYDDGTGAAQTILIPGPPSAAGSNGGLTLYRRDVANARVAFAVSGRGIGDGAGQNGVLQVFGTDATTSDVNFEDLEIRAIYQNSFIIGSNAGGTGVVRDVWLNRGITTSTPYLKLLSGGLNVPTGISLGIGVIAPLAPLHIFNSGGGRLMLAADTTHFNFLVGQQVNVTDAFEITPSTVVGGSVFTTPALVITSSRIVSIGSGLSTVGAVAGDLLTNNGNAFRSANAANNASLALLSLDSSNRTNLIANSAAVVIGSPLTQTTIGANGAASALTANPLGYLRVNIGATTAIIPYYNS